MKRLIAAFTILLLSACESSIQTTSGSEYLSRYPSDFSTNDVLDERVRAIAAVEPVLRFPARIGLARIDRGNLSGIPEDEAEAWLALGERLGDGYGEFVLVSRLISELVAGDIHGHSITGTVQKIRLAAARQHMDAVLIYEVYGTGNARKNPLSVTDVTILGAFLLPGRSVETTGYASALLVDVRNGYPYGMADASVDRASIATAYSARDVTMKLADQAKSAAAIALTREVESMVSELRASLARLADAEPAPLTALDFRTTYPNDNHTEQERSKL